MKNILFVASECVPFVKTGGLADVVGSLPKSLDKKKYDVRVILPQYECMKPQYKERLECVCYFQLDNRIYVGINKLVEDGTTFYFVDNKQYFSGSKPYFDLFNDLERFAYFSKAVLSALPLIGFRPDIIHAHDWQASLVPVYLNTVFQGDPFFQGIKTIFTIHNIRFQGCWNVGHLRWVTGLPDECFQVGKLVSPYQDTTAPWDEWNATMMRGGIVYSDWVTTVSESYAREIQTPAFSDGLDDILKWRNNRLKGIVNGIDYDIWNPSTDQFITSQYNLRNYWSNKKINKKALQKEFGLPENEDVFTIGIISRLTNQKGLDLIDAIMDQIARMNINLVVLGTGDEWYENMFRYYEAKYPEKIRAKITYDEALSHRMYAGLDALLVPSAFEPCGLTQLIALRYGTLPIVHEIGGLKDTVKPYNQYEGSGTGFSFANYSSWELMDRINHASWLYYENTKEWKAMEVRAMKENWSWENSSKTYMDLYNQL